MRTIACEVDQEYLIFAAYLVVLSGLKDDQRIILIRALVIYGIFSDYEFLITKTPHALVLYGAVGCRAIVTRKRSLWRV